MSNGVLTSIQNISLVLSGLALLISAYCLWQNLSLNRVRKTFFSGKSGLDLESVILGLKERLADGQRQQEALEQTQQEIKQALGFAVQKVGLVRFNPFEGSGGNFSFCLALLDNHDSGVVITSMYGREQNRIYSKQVLQGISDVQLTKEEQQAVELSHHQHQTPQKKQKK